MSHAKPIRYTEEVRPEDTERAQQTLTVTLFPDENKPAAVDFTGTCPRCDDQVHYREWLILVASSLRVNKTQMEAILAHLDEVGVDRSHGDETFDLTCSCDIAHPNRPKDKQGCGATFRVRVSWP